MAEADVALTDYALAIECGLFAWRLGRAPQLARWLGRMFLALALGLAAVSAWGAGASLLSSVAGTRCIAGMALAGWVAYAAAVVAGAQSFALAITNYLGAALYLSFCLATAFVRTRDHGALVATAGIALVFAGAGLQYARVDCLPLRLTHNGLFHVVQGAAFALLFLGARRLTGRESCSHDGSS